MDDTTQTGETPGSRLPWAAITAWGVVLLALSSAIYFVQRQQEELRSANSLSQAGPAAQPAASVLTTPDAAAPLTPAPGKK